MATKVLDLCVSGTELRIISKWYVYLHILEFSGLVITVWVAPSNATCRISTVNCEFVFYLSRYVNCSSGCFQLIKNSSD